MMDDFTWERVPGDERLARFIMRQQWVRADGSVKQDAFIPPRDLNLSVTRHAKLSMDQLWSRGRSVADQIRRRLIGRADIAASDVRTTGRLDVVAVPLVENPEHAHILGWPAEKPAQKTLAQKLAAAAGYVPLPVSWSC
jgi:hypothetical protein